MNDLQVIQALIGRDPEVTMQFFFRDCRPLFVAVMRRIFDYDVDYDEFVSELYLYLMENDAARLRQFRGRSRIYQWLKIVAIHYFLDRKSYLAGLRTVEYDISLSGADETADSVSVAMARMDVMSLLGQMKNRRQAYVLKRLVLDDAETEEVAAELNVSVAALYNIKKRALTALAGIAGRNCNYEKGLENIR